MLRHRIIPCLLLKNTGLVKTVRFKRPNYIGDPINAVRIFNEKEVDELVFLDITATSENKNPNLKLIEEIANECFMPFAYGGGIRDVKMMKQIFRLGVEKIVINSMALENPDFVKAAAAIFGNQSIVIAVDIKKSLFGKYEIYSHSGTRKARIGLLEYLKIIERNGVGEIFVNSIDRDGTMSGYDINLLKMITDAVDTPVIACGGAAKANDFYEAIHHGGVQAVAAGSMFVYYGAQNGVLINFPNKHEIEGML